MKKTTLLLFLILSSISFLQMDCKDEPPVTVDPPPTGPDTTSHNFTWTTYTFGGNAGSCYFKDVAIINDSNIWAVGAIYTSPETLYNAAHWDGKKWSLLRVPSIGSVQYPPLQAVWIIAKNNILLSWGGGIITFDGITFTDDKRMNSLLSGAINKVFALNLQNIYCVGNAGTIVHYNGSTWTKQESGTTIDLRDVWGSADGKTVWACGYSNDNSKSILLKYENNQWNTIWQRDKTSSIPPFGYYTTSFWMDKSIFITAGRAIFQISQLDTILVATLPWFPNRIRGNAENNIAVVGDEGMIWHYNGANWKELNIHSGQLLSSVAVSKNNLIVVGSDHASFLSQAIIYWGVNH